MAETIKKKVFNTSPLSLEEIVIQYTSLVQKIARGLARRSTDPLEDLVQVGMMGLLEAAKRYDENQNTTFKTYATHFITGHIRHYLRDKQQLFKGPRSLQELSYRLHCITTQLEQDLDREPTNCEVAQALEVPLERLIEIRSYDRRIKVLWLDQELFETGGEDKRPLLDTVPANESGQEQMDTRILITQALSRLDPLYQQLLKYRYFDDLTQAEIATRMALSQMEVCRKLKMAEKELKSHLYHYVD